jgi:hypothetical protein
VATLKDLDSTAFARVFDAAMRHNRMTEADIKELAGN